MTRRQQALLVSNGALTLTESEHTKPADDEAVVRVVWGGICGSDLHYWQHGSSGTSVLHDPMILGHEVVGIVAEVAVDGTGPEAGARVAIHPAEPCGRCEQCVAGRSRLCRNMRYLGSAAQRPHTDGGFARWINVHTDRLRTLPTEADLLDYVMVEPASVAWHAARRADPLEGRRAVIVGAGPIGLALVAVLRVAGAAHVTVIDIHERPLRIAEQLGADVTVLSGSDATAHEDEADVAFECSGTPAGLEHAAALTRPGGELVMVGNQRPGTVPFPASSAISRELTIKGSYRFDEEFDDVIAAINARTLHLRPIISATFPVADYETAFHVAADPSKSSKVLLHFAENS